MDALKKLIYILKVLKNSKRHLNYKVKGLNNIKYEIFLNLSNATDYIIENEPLVNRYISVPKDKGEWNLNLHQEEKIVP